MSNAYKQSFTSTETSIVISMGVISGCIAALQPILLGGLLEEGQLNVVQVGRAATAEALGMAVATTIAAALLKPVRLRLIAGVAWISSGSARLSKIEARFINISFDFS